MLSDQSNVLWLRTCELLGWWISAEKSPAPSAAFDVIGIRLSLDKDGATISVTHNRLAKLDAIMEAILAKQRLGCGEASSLTGQLGFTLCACFGRFGRAKIRPFIRRSYEIHQNMNTQLTAALVWWRKFLSEHRPKAIPISLKHIDVIVSYSDGEGADAGVGVAVWSPRLTDGPLAAFSTVPDGIRNLWHRRAGRSEFYKDIFLVEAIGPLLLLETFPKIMKNSLWIHYIDNVGSQHALIKGSSSIDSGDEIIGLTWARIERLGLWLYADRVDSAGNPVDGLSRGRAHGPWRQVYKAIFPADLLRIAAAAETYQ
jgi:hypothetical protein